MAYQILTEKCRRSGLCVVECPMDAISTDISGRVSIDPAMCTDCGSCSDICPEGAIKGLEEGNG